MKDVSEILAKRLKRLEAPFSREWLVDFSAFMQFMQTNPFNTQILEALKKEKEEAHASLICNLKRFFEDGKKCLEEIKVKIEAANHSSNRT